MSQGELERLRSEKAPALDACVRALDRAPATIGKVFVPGRIEFLGKHTDYAGGRSLICALDRGFCVAFAPREDRTIHIIDAKSAAESTFELLPDLTPIIGEWTNYPMTVARRIARNFGPDLRGADIAFLSDLPQAAGLSSSSALIIALFLALSKANELQSRAAYRDSIKSKEDLAGYLGTIENGQGFGTLAGDEGVGTFGGSQDHTAILCARAGTLCQYSFAPVKFEREISLPRDYVFVIACSGVTAEKTVAARAKYNQLSFRVAEILKRCNEQSGRADATLASTVRACGGKTPPLGDMALEDRLQQFIEESERIIPAVGDAVQGNRFDLIGPLIDRSQQLAESLLGNQVEETISLQRSARELGAVAASAFGAGFGGSVWALIRESDAPEFESRWCEQYLKRFPNHRATASCFQTRAGPAVAAL